MKDRPHDALSMNMCAPSAAAVTLGSGTCAVAAAPTTVAAADAFAAADLHLVRACILHVYNMCMCMRARMCAGGWGFAIDLLSSRGRRTRAGPRH